MHFAHLPHVTPTEVFVQIGRNALNYFLFKTNAPEDYDWFETFTLLDYDADKGKARQRFVLIAKDRIDAQVTRYFSGLYVTEPCDLMSAQEIEEKLWAALHRTALERGAV